MHRAGARAAPDGSARAAHRDAAAPLASEHGGGVTERVATLLLSLHRGIIRRLAVYLPPSRAVRSMCGRVRRAVAVGAGSSPPSSHFYFFLIVCRAQRERTRERESLSSLASLGLAMHLALPEPPVWCTPGSDRSSENVTFLRGFASVPLRRALSGATPLAVATADLS